ncbi:MAG: aminotransferase class V-fold PLP-dependent enzyme, partial [Acetobacteraceae bacterium]|nr:aminotransferase class V-fold PLP-dependent enzyme [Acetobacteraceae bacterium]
RLAAIGGATPGLHAALPLQGSGHFAVEAAVRSFVPAAGKLLLPMTGAYADRMHRLAREAGRVVVPLAVRAERPVEPAAVSAALAADPEISHVGLVYSETGSGVIHDARAIGAAVRRAGRRMLLDAVSAFGALPLDLSAQPEIDAAVFTPNKCLESLPGLAVVLARTDRLKAGLAGSWCFDLADTLCHAERVGWGSFRFTPPAQVIAALIVALDLFDAEGGRLARFARYEANSATLYDGVLRLGLSPCLPRDVQGPVVMNVHAPADPAWDLQGFVDLLKSRGFVISNFYNTPEPSFRVGCIGAITPADMARFIDAMDWALRRLGVRHRAGGRDPAGIPA